MHGLFRSRSGRIGTSTAATLIMWAMMVMTCAAEPIKVPFGLKWGLTKKQMERILKSQPVKLVEKRTVEDRDAWTLTGFAQDHLDCTIIYFDQGGRMNEVELQYKGIDWSPEKYEGHANYFRRNFEQRYGRGREIVSASKKDGAAVFKMEGYEWRTTDVILRLIHFAARRKAETYNTISVHYRSTLSQ